MSFLLKLVRLKAFIAFFFVGLLFTVMGSFIAFSSTNLEKVNALVLNVNKEYDYDLDSYVYEAEVEYYVNDVRYEGNISVSYIVKANDNIVIYYQEGHPNRISGNGSSFVPYIFIAIGGITIIGSLIFAIRSIKFMKDDKMYVENKEFSSTNTDLSGSCNDYYFHYKKNNSQSYILEDLNRVTLYEANCMKVNFLKASPYEFVDCRTGFKTMHEIGNTITINKGTSAVNSSFAMPRNSRFKIDKVNIWDYLDKKGCFIELHFDNFKGIFNVYQYNNLVAVIEQSGSNIMEDNAKKAFGDFPINGLYKVKCDDRDMELAFLVCFALSRVEIL